MIAGHGTHDDQVRRMPLPIARIAVGNTPRPPDARQQREIDAYVTH
jgi:hypothetical protein